MRTQAEKGRDISCRSTSARDAFIIPNPWDAGTARITGASRIRGAGHHQYAGYAFSAGRLRQHRLTAAS
jgi:hypothetical protein